MSQAAAGRAYPVLGDCILCLPTKGETKAVAEPRHISEISPRATIVKKKERGLPVTTRATGAGAPQNGEDKSAPYPSSKK